MKFSFFRVFLLLVVLAGSALLSFANADETSDKTDSPRVFSSIVNATAVFDEHGTRVPVDEYDTLADALKAGDFAAFLTKAQNAEQTSGVTSDLSFLALAVDAYRQGDADYLEYLDKVPEGSADRHNADKLAAWFLALEGKHDAALAALNDANGDRITIVEEMSLAAMLEGIGRTQQSIAVYSTLLPKDIRKPRNDFDIQNYALDQYRTISVRLASLHQQLGDIDSAAEVYDVMAKADPENAALYKGYIANIRSDTPSDVETLTPETAMALAVIDIAAVDYRNRMFAANRMGLRLTEFDMRFAIFLHTALLLDPTNEHRWMSISEQLTSKRLYEGAAHILDVATVDSPWISLSLATTQLKLLNKDAAREALSTAVAIAEEDDKRAVFASAMNGYAKLGDTRATQNLAFRVLSMIDDAPNKPATYASLAYAYRNLGRLDKAVEYMQEAVKLDDSHSRRMGLWSILAEAGRIEEAEKGFRSEFLSRLDDPYMFNGLGYFLIVHTDKLKEGYTLLMKADAMADDNPFITDSLGWAYYKLGHIEKGRALIERSRQVYLPNIHWEVEDHLGDIYWHEDKKDKAKEFWTRSLEEYPPARDRKRITDKIQNGFDEDKPIKQELPQVDLDQETEEDKDI